MAIAPVYLWLSRGGLLTRKGRTSYAPGTVTASLNSGFETDTYGWIAGDNTTISRQTTVVKSGVGAAQLVSYAAGDISMFMDSSVYQVAVTPGQTYEFSIYVATSGTPRNTDVQIDWYSASGAYISSDIGGSPASTTIMTIRTSRAAAPAGAAFAVGAVTIRGTAGAGATHYVDTASLASATAVTPASEVVMLNSTAENLTGANPISNADMWTFVGRQIGGTTTFVRESVVSVGGINGKVVNHLTNSGTITGIAMPVPLSQPCNEAYIEYDVRFIGTKPYTSTSATGMWGGGGKLPGLCGVLPNTPDNKTPPTGGNPDPRGWSARFMWRTQLYNPGRDAILARGGVTQQNIVCSYVYDPSQGNPGNLTYGQDKFPAVGTSKGEFINGQWHHIKQYYKMNTVRTDAVYNATDGTASGGDYDLNGVHKIFFDGVLVYTATNCLWKIFQAANITHMQYSLFYGGADATWGPTEDTNIQVDNLNIVRVAA